MAVENGSEEIINKTHENLGEEYRKAVEVAVSKFCDEHRLEPLDSISKLTYNVDGQGFSLPRIVFVRKTSDLDSILKPDFKIATINIGKEEYQTLTILNGKTFQQSHSRDFTLSFIPIIYPAHRGDIAKIHDALLLRDRGVPMQLPTDDAVQQILKGEFEGSFKDAYKLNLEGLTTLDFDVVYLNFLERVGNDRDTYSIVYLYSADAHELSLFPDTPIRQSEIDEIIRLRRNLRTNFGSEVRMRFIVPPSQRVLMSTSLQNLGVSSTDLDSSQTGKTWNIPGEASSYYGRAEEIIRYTLPSEG